jgi:hypothetical protein
MLYKSASNLWSPCLYICPVANVLGRPPPHSLLHGRQKSPHNSKLFQRVASGDTQQDEGNCSILYKVNFSMWHYCSPRMISIAEAERIRSKRVSKGRIRAAKIRKHHSEAARAA